MSYLAFPVVAMERQVICLPYVLYTSFQNAAHTFHCEKRSPGEVVKVRRPDLPWSASVLSVLSTVPILREMYRRNILLPLFHHGKVKLNRKRTQKKEQVYGAADF